MKNKAQFFKTSQLDNLEMLRMEEQAKPFPLHSHDAYCVSLMKSGTEIMRVGDNDYIGLADRITIINPYEVHSNPKMEGNERLAFDTVYMSPDLVSFFNKKELCVFRERNISDPILSYKFKQMVMALQTNSSKLFLYVETFILHLLQYKYKSDGEGTILYSPKIKEVLEYIEHNIELKFTLENLAQITGTNIYRFSKDFKKETGISPINYILMKKIFRAKSKITADSKLTHIAYDYDFYDMAYFSKTFQKFVGVSPRVYQNSLKGKM